MAKYTVLVAHNHYRQPGGEDQVFSAESDLLETNGHRVIRYTVHNDTIEKLSKRQVATNTLWNNHVYKELRHLIRMHGVEVVHLHNTLPLLSPAAYYAARAEQVPVVQTLHNYRLYCPNGLFFRKGTVCEACARWRIPWPSVLYSCYRDSRLASGAVATMLTLHRVLRTWRNKVNVYIAATAVSRDKFVDCGLPADKICVKPHFVHPDPGVGSGTGGYGLFVGRLTEEKGVRTLLAAIRSRLPETPMLMVGEGPLAPLVAATVKDRANVRWLGQQPPSEVSRLMGEASFLVVPSECYEVFGLVVVESFAKGTPVIAANIGALGELVDHGKNGLRFGPRNADDLAQQILRAVDRPAEFRTMRKVARAEFESKYTAADNYQLLMQIYDKARATC